MGILPSDNADASYIQGCNLLCSPFYPWTFCYCTCCYSSNTCCYSSA